MKALNKGRRLLSHERMGYFLAILFLVGLVKNIVELAQSIETRFIVNAITWTLLTFFFLVTARIKAFRVSHPILAFFSCLLSFYDEYVNYACVFAFTGGVLMLWVYGYFQKWKILKICVLAIGFCSFQVLSAWKFNIPFTRLFFDLLLNTLVAIGLPILFWDYIAPHRVKKLRLTELDLTEAEAQIFRLVVENLTQKEIASKIGASASTCRNHLSNIYRKLNVPGWAELRILIDRHEVIL